MVLRRIVHKMFDMVKCENWEVIIDNGVYREFKFLVLRDSYLTFDLICEPAQLEEQLNKYYRLLKKHLTTCKVSKQINQYL